MKPKRRSPTRPFVLVFLCALGGVAAWVVMAGDGDGSGGAPIVGATLRDSINDSNGTIPDVAEPGETIDFTAKVTNSASGDVNRATGVAYRQTVDANTTLDANSLRVTPLACNDQYACIGNVGISVPAGTGVLANDVDPDQPLPANAVTSIGGIATPQGGVVKLFADGSFTYDPAVGFTGMDSFTYTIADSDGLADASTGTGVVVVTIEVTDVVWFIDGSSVGNNSGTLSNPFTSLASFNSANQGGVGEPGAGDCLFIASGNYADGITLLDGQTLLGQGASDSIEDVCAIALPTHSRALPVTSGARPVVNNPGGNGINLASANTIRGLDIGDTGANNFGIRGVAVGALSISEVAISGAGGGVDLSDGTLAVTFDSISSNASIHGIKLSNTDGGFTVSGIGAPSSGNDSGGTILASSSHAVVLSGSTGVTLQSMRILDPGGNGVDAGTGSGDIVLSGVTIDLVGITGTAAIGHNGFNAVNLIGTNRLNMGSLIQNIDRNNNSAVRVANTNTDLTLFEIEDSTFRDSSSGQSNVLITQAGSSVMTFGVLGSTFTNLFAQAVTASAGSSVNNSGTLHTRIGGAGVGDGNGFADAQVAGDGENNVGVLVGNGATHHALVQGNTFRNVASGGGVANTSVVRLMNNGGIAVFETRDNHLGGFNFSIGGRHGIGLIAEPPSATTAPSSLIVDGNEIDDLPDKEGVYINSREHADDTDVTISNNDIGVNGAIGEGDPLVSDNEAIDVEARFQKIVRLLVEGNTIHWGDDVAGSASGSEVLFVEAKDGADINATVRNNAFKHESTNSSAHHVEVEAEDAGSIVHASISGNTITDGQSPFVELDGGSGVLDIEQSGTDDIASSNGISAGDVNDGGVDNFNAGAPPLPTHPGL